MPEAMGRRRFLRVGVLAGAGFLACRPGRISNLDGKSDRSVALRLGYPPKARLVIVHADDVGFDRSVNSAVRTAFERGAIDSGSVMVTCPGFPEFAAWARSRPGLDLGIHLTFTSERPALRWGPVLDSRQVPTLVGPDGHFPPEWSPGRRVNPREIEAEIRAQIERAREAGIDPTHLDSHQHFLQFHGPAVFTALMRVARDYHLPVRVSRSWFRRRPYLRTAPELNVPLDSQIEMRVGSAPPECWRDWYVSRIHEMRAGLTEILVHPGYDDEELEDLTRDNPNWGAGWRQRDLDAVLSREFAEALSAVGAVRITWHQVGELLRV